MRRRRARRACHAPRSAARAAPLPLPLRCRFALRFACTQRTCCFVFTYLLNPSLSIYIDIRRAVVIARALLAPMVAPATEAAARSSSQLAAALAAAAGACVS